MAAHRQGLSRPRAFSGRLARRRLAGFSLVESLIAMTLFAIGFLSLAALQVTGIRSTTESHQRSIAQLLVQQMSDRIRANRLLILRGNRTAYTDTDPESINAGTVTQCHDASVPSCNGNQIASYDLLQWRLNYAALLPAADGLVCYDDTPTATNMAEFTSCGGGDILTVRLSWAVRGSTAAETTRHFIIAPLAAF